MKYSSSGSLRSLSRPSSYSERDADLVIEPRSGLIVEAVEGAWYYGYFTEFAYLEEMVLRFEEVVAEGAKGFKIFWVSF
jgi:hypothetical protein